MNKVTLLGYLSQDPTTKEYPDRGFVMTRFSVAVTDMKNYNLTYFFNCVAWNQTAEYINSHLKKGDFVAIDGRLTTRNYINDAGAKTYVTEINVDAIRSLGSKSSKAEENSSEKVNIDDLISESQKTTNLSIDETPNETKTEDNEDVTVDWEDDLE